MLVLINAESCHVCLFDVVSLMSLSLAEILFPLWAVQGHQLVQRWPVYPLVRNILWGKKKIHKQRKIIKSILCERFTCRKKEQIFPVSSCKAFCFIAQNQILPSQYGSTSLCKEEWEVVRNFNLSERFYQFFYLLPNLSDVRSPCSVLQGSYYQVCLTHSNAEEIRKYYCHLFWSKVLLGTIQESVEIYAVKTHGTT